MPSPTWETFVGFLLAAFGAGIGWASGNVLVTLVARAVT